MIRPHSPVIMLILFGLLVRATLCKAQELESPSIEETLAYIASHLQLSNTDCLHVWQPSRQFSTDGTYLVLTCASPVGSNGGESHVTVKAPILALTSNPLVVSQGDSTSFSLGCEGNKQCVSAEGATTNATGLNVPYQNRATVFSIGYITPDPEAAQRLQRALRHLVLLMQQQYRAQHPADPNDPFGKP
jgi:hypothetical protein